MNWTRRQFLLNGLRVSALVPSLPALGLAALASKGARARAHGDRCLVVLQLTGGNDGLNTVVPHQQDAYYLQRPTLALKPGSLHALDQAHGLHPAMARLAQCFQEGRVAIIHGVGSPHSDRSHFRSLEIWHTAEPERRAGEVGWLGRLADQLAHDDPLAIPAMSLDDEQLPLCLRAEHTLAPSVRDPEGFQLDGDAQRISLAQRELCRPAAEGDLGFLQRAACSAFEAAERMQSLQRRQRAESYPEGVLARKLRLISDLVQGGFGTRLFQLSLGGFDTHSRQARTQEGLLRELSQALGAFLEDLRLGGWGERVTTLVFSEFGRRAQENASMGTDHGRGAPVFLLGDALRGGMHGTPPDLSQLVEGDVAVTTDFRSIYTTLERDWLGLRPGTEVAACEGLLS